MFRSNRRDDSFAPVLHVQRREFVLHRGDVGDATQPIRVFRREVRHAPLPETLQGQTREIGFVRADVSFEGGANRVPDAVLEPAHLSSAGEGVFHQFEPLAKPGAPRLPRSARAIRFGGVKRQK